VIYPEDFCGLRTGFLLAYFTMGGGHEKLDKILIRIAAESFF
jgi:hypothetical protein